MRNSANGSRMKLQKQNKFIYNMEKKSRMRLLFLFFISKVTLSVEHNFTEEMEEKQNTVMFK